MTDRAATEPRFTAHHVAEDGTVFVYFDAGDGPRWWRRYVVPEHEQPRARQAQGDGRPGDE